MENRCLLSVVGVEGSPVTISKEFTDLGLSDSHTATINWGDGNTTPGTLVGTLGGSGTVTGSHVYADNGDYTITISVAENDVESDSDTMLASITNVAPTVRNVTVTSLINGNDFATLSGNIYDRGIGDSFTLTVDWGAGTPVSYSIAAGATSFSVSHNYLADVPTLTSGDTFTVTGTLTDDDGDSAPLANSAGGLITFDDLTTRNTFFGQDISTSYQGFAWGYSRFSGLENAAIPTTSVFWDWASATVSNPGVSPGPTPVSGESYAWNSGGPQSLFIDFRAPATVTSAWFATLSSGYSFNATTIQLFAYDESGSLQSESSVLNLTNSFQQLNAGFTGVHFLEIRANASGRNFSIDDLQLGVPLAVTIDKVPPTLSALSATSILENGTTTLSGHIANVAAPDTVTLEIDWNNDGTIDETHLNVGAGNFSYNSQFPDDAPTGTPVDHLPINVRITNDAGSVAASTAVEVTNVAPVLSNLSATPIVESGTTIFRGTIADVGVLDTFTVDIDWDNDGTIDETHLNVAAGNFSYSHQYLDDNANGVPVGTIPINVTVTDDDTGTIRGSTLVEVSNVAPTLSDLSATPIVEGGTMTFRGTIADVGVLDTFTVEIDWDNDGTIDETHRNVAAGNFSYVHQYPDDNPSGSPVDNMPINVTVTDDDSGTVHGHVTVEVTNVAPTLSDLSATPIVEAGTTTFSGTIADVGVQDTFTVEIDWDDDGVTDQTHLNVGAGRFSYKHQYLDDNPTRSPVDNMLIHVTVTDDDTGAIDSSTLVEVSNLVPVLAPITTSATRGNKAVVGQQISVSGLFTDVGTLDTHTVIVQWDDGSVSNSERGPDDFSGLDVDGGGVGSFTGTHSYTTGGIFEVVVTVIDDDTGESNSSTVEVWVSGVRLTGDGELQIIGTNGKDVVSASLVEGTDGGPEQVKVVANLDVPAGSDGGNKNKKGKGKGGGSNVGADVYHFSSDDIQTVRIILCAGDDHANLNGSSEASGQPWYVSSLMEGDGGNDQLTGGAGADVILGGTGNDRLSGHDGNDVLLGGEGRDDLNGGRGHDVLAGAAGNDKLSGNAGADILIGGDGKDDLKAGKGSDLLIADIWTNEDIVAALDSLHDAWTGPSSNREKSSALTVAGGLLDASTLTADAFKDTLKGDNIRNLCFASASDRIKGRKNIEDTSSSIDVAGVLRPLGSQP